MSFLTGNKSNPRIEDVGQCGYGGERGRERRDESVAISRAGRCKGLAAHAATAGAEEPKHLMIVVLLQVFSSTLSFSGSKFELGCAALGRA